MRLTLLLSVFLLYLTSTPCLSLDLRLSHKLAIDRFLDELEFQNLKITDVDFIRGKLDCINGHIHDSILEVSYRENSNYTLRRYKKLIEYNSEKASSELKEAVDTHANLLHKFDWEFKQINVEIVSKIPRSATDDKYGLELLLYLSRGPYDRSIAFLNQTDIFHREELVNKIMDLTQRRFGSQTDVLKDVIVLHKLGIELELVNLVYFRFRKYVEPDKLEKKLKRLVEMLDLLTKFELFLTGCFEYPFEISISKIMNSAQGSESTSQPDIRFVVYPNARQGKEFCDSYYSKTASIGDVPRQDQGSAGLKQANQELPEYNNDEFPGYGSPSKLLVLINETRLEESLSNRAKLLERPMQDLKFDPRNFNDGVPIEHVKAEVDIISPIPSVEISILKGRNDVFSGVSNLNNTSNKIFSPFSAYGDVGETLKSTNEEFKSYIKKKEVEQFNKVSGGNTRDSKLETLDAVKCFEYQYVCKGVRHLDCEEMMELDRDLFPNKVELPFGKDSNLIWSVSESLVDNFGARRRLLEFVSEKIKDFESSVNRSNTSPLMSTGEGGSDHVSFYRAKHGKILSILFALKDFMSSSNSHEISAARLRFIEEFVPLTRRASTQKFKFSPYSRTENALTNKSFKSNKQVMKLRSPSYSAAKNKRIHLASGGYLLSPRPDEIINEPSLHDLCTRFITILSVTKSVMSFNYSSYKFSQKVCSMIFEQPIHNILSIDDFAWLTGLTLVRTVNFLVRQQKLPEEMFIDHKTALRAINHSLSQKPYNFHQACTQSLVSQKSTIIYHNNISLHRIKPIMKTSCAEYFGVSVFLHES